MPIASIDPRTGENLETFIRELVRAKPAAAKGTYLKSLTVSSTMSPGVKLDVNEIVAALT